MPRYPETYKYVLTIRRSDVIELKESLSNQLGISDVNLYDLHRRFVNVEWFLNEELGRRDRDRFDHEIHTIAREFQGRVIRQPVTVIYPTSSDLRLRTLLDE